MSRKYLVRFTPIEPYFFGGENTFRVEEKNKYYSSSLLIPSASTILGTMRYILLEQNGLLNTNRRYTNEEKEKCSALIGPHSYNARGSNSFGKIKSVSPLFLTDGKDFYVKTPLNCKSKSIKTQYEPITLSSVGFETSFGSTRFPAEEEFKSKNKVEANSYTRLSDKKIFNNLFLPYEKVGVAKAKNDEAFFKKKYFVLKDGFSFAIVVELEDDVVLENSLCYMGREKSAFILNVEETLVNIEKEISSSLGSVAEEGFFYFFGDTIVAEAATYSDFAMVDTENIRMLQTKTHKEILTTTCITEFYQVIKAGSVTYAQDIKNDNDTSYGFNKIIKIGE